MRLTDDEIERLAELERKATPGEWEAQEPAMCPDFPRAKIKPLKIEGRLYGFAMIKNADATFIAELRNAAPALLEEVKAARRVIDAARFFRIYMQNGVNVGNYKRLGCGDIQVDGGDWERFDEAMREYEKAGGGG